MDQRVAELLKWVRVPQLTHPTEWKKSLSEKCPINVLELRGVF